MLDGSNNQMIALLLYTLLLLVVRLWCQLEATAELPSLMLLHLIAAPCTHLQPHTAACMQKSQVTCC
jgi:hypothetical protein